MVDSFKRIVKFTPHVGFLFRLCTGGWFFSLAEANGALCFLIFAGGRENGRILYGRYEETGRCQRPCDF